MVVKLQEADGVKVYNVTADKALPAWVKKTKNARLSRDAEYARHIDLIQVRAFRLQGSPFEHSASFGLQTRLIAWILPSLPPPGALSAMWQCIGGGPARVLITVHLLRARAGCSSQVLATAASARAAAGLGLPLSVPPHQGDAGPAVHCGHGCAPAAGRGVRRGAAGAEV